MSEYTVTLTDEQELALQYELENYNKVKPQLAAPSTTMVTTTPEEYLNERIGMMLNSTYNQVKSTVETFEAVTEAHVEPLTEELLERIKTPEYIKSYIRKKHLTHKEENS